MKCFKCDKEMDREGDGSTIKGVDIRVSPPPEPTEEERQRGKLVAMQETIDYNNLQLGKYSDGNGGCHVGICYECYIDGLFHLG